MAPSRRKAASQYDAPLGSSEEDSDDQHPLEGEAESSGAESEEVVQQVRRSQ